MGRDTSCVLADREDSPVVLCLSGNLHTVEELSKFLLCVASVSGVCSGVTSMPLAIRPIALTAHIAGVMFVGYSVHCCQCANRKTLLSWRFVFVNVLT